MNKFSTRNNKEKFDRLLQELRNDAREFGIANVGQDIQRFVDKAKEWGIPSDDKEIVSAVVNARDARIYVVTRDSGDNFRVSRIFTIGGKWEISVDSDGTLSQALDNLLANA